MTLKEYLKTKKARQNIAGYYYLLEAVEMMKGMSLPKVKVGTVYRAIAQKYGTNYQVIERNIRYCLRSCNIMQSVSSFLYEWAGNEQELEQKTQKKKSMLDIYKINSLLTDCMIEIQDYNLKGYTTGDIFERLSAMFYERLEKEYLCQS